METGLCVLLADCIFCLQSILLENALKINLPAKQEEWKQGGGKIRIAQFSLSGVTVRSKAQLFHKFLINRLKKTKKTRLGILDMHGIFPTL